MKIVILNGSPSGKKSNCEFLIKKTIPYLKSEKIEVVHLSDMKWSLSSKKKLFGQIKRADGFIFVTGTYWDSWGSPMQSFLEQATELEGSPSLLGKPALVFVLNHSVGGKAVLSRLQGVLSTLGCLIPPMSGFVYSWVSDQLLKNSKKSEALKDLWSLDDLEFIAANFLKSLRIKTDWQSWPVDRKDYRKVWIND